MALPICLFAWVAPDAFYENFNVPTNAIRGPAAVPMFLALLAYASMSWVGERLRFPAAEASDRGIIGERTFLTSYYGLGVLVLAAAAIYLGRFAADPDLALGVLTGREGAAYEARRSVEQIAGVTSVVNLSSLVVLLYLLRSRVSTARKSRLQRAMLLSVLAVAVSRVLLHSERLALIEAAVPMAVVGFAIGRPRRWTPWIPAFGVVLLVVFFAGTEYLRSWVNFYDAKYQSVWQFASLRILGYYATALDNGAVYYSANPTFVAPVMSANWIWRLPVWDGQALLQAALAGAESPDDVMAAWLNPEFNNMSGLYAPLTDFGPVFGVMAWGALGLFSGCLFRAFRGGRPTALLLFPTWYIGVLEMTRIFYWGDSRYFPTLVVTLGFGLLFHVSSRALKGKGAASGRRFRSVA